MTSESTIKYLQDYKKPEYLIPEIHLHFDLHEDRTRVRSRLAVIHREALKAHWPLTLCGENLKLIEVKRDGRILSTKEYDLTDTALTLTNLPSHFTLEIETEINPSANTALEGLYMSNGIFCTQNESEGFRKITYFLDRPDIMSKFTTTITAEKAKYPVLLANGNPTAQGDLPNGRHYVTWKDPFPKPCYLFALVAGELEVVKGEFVTKSGRKIDLRIYVEYSKLDQCAHAMECLKKAMKWDEDTFGLECDLDTYMIVAVQDFNFGAMENKGLNVFNAQYILANPETATDGDYESILSVIGHEYFHNWTGNRVTCRDWFQITLKEGLTIFRDQEFSADMSSRAVKRIGNVRMLRDHQFVEDAGPNAHPVRPRQYMEINNFYTVTVYEKGAEVIRMIETLIGREVFRKGIQKYFDLYDGEAVTTEDFVYAMEQVSGMDLTQFKNWYDQAGTPVCQVKSEYDPEHQTYTLTVRQLPPAIRKSEKSKPFHFPFSVGLLDDAGKEIPLKLADGDRADKPTTVVLQIAKPEQSFTFKNVPVKPVPSLLRNFSAPVRLEYPYTYEELAFLLSHDTDLFNRYEAGQRLTILHLNELIELHQKGKSMKPDKKVLAAYAHLIKDQGLDLSFKAEALSLPSLVTLTEPMPVCDFDSAFAAREFLLKALAREHEQLLRSIYESLHDDGPYQTDAYAMGKRALKNTALAYLVNLDQSEYLEWTWRQFETASNMTDRLTALQLLCHSSYPEREKALHQFYEKWYEDPVIMVKWFAVQAASKRDDTFRQVRDLEDDVAFHIKNPSHVRALIGVYARNLIHFHKASGEGYAYLADKILEIDRFNPNAAAHLATAYQKYPKLDGPRKEKMRSELERILAAGDLSPESYEIISRTLNVDTVRK